MFIIPVPRLRGSLVAYFGARAERGHLIEVFCTCDSGLFVLTQVETMHRRGLTEAEYSARNPGRIPTALDLSDRVHQWPQELTTTPDRHQALALLLRQGHQHMLGSPRFCFGQVDTPAQFGFKQAPVVPTELVDMVLPPHPLLWQAGQKLDYLPYRLHRLAQPAVPTNDQQPERPQRLRKPAA